MFAGASPHALISFRQKLVLTLFGRGQQFGELRRIEREVIARGIFTSVPDLARKLRRYINAYSAAARPIQRKYSDPTRRLRTHCDRHIPYHWSRRVLQ
jgi:hypothetical protein